MEVPGFFKNGYQIIKIYIYFIKEKFNVSKWPLKWELFNEIIALDIDLCFLSKIIKNADSFKTFPDL